MVNILIFLSGPNLGVTLSRSISIPSTARRYCIDLNGKFSDGNTFDYRGNDRIRSRFGHRLPTYDDFATNELRDLAIF